MPDSGVESHWGLDGEPPVEVEVTVLTAPRGSATRERAGRITALRYVRAVPAVVLGVAATALVIAALTTGGGGAPAIRQDGAARQPRPAAAAATNGYPLGCVSIAIVLHDPRFARADFDRTLPCGRYGGHATAVFQRLGGGWRPRVDTIRYTCPLPWLPPGVPAEPAGCP